MSQVGLLTKEKEEACVKMPYFVVVKETEDEGERKCTGKSGQGYLSCRDKGLPLEGDQADVAHRQRMVYKDKGADPILR